MSVREIEYQTEAEALLNQPEGSLPPLQMLDRLHRYGVWSRGSTHPRGSLNVPAPPRLEPNLIGRILRFIEEKTERDLCRKALLAVGQWGGEESLARPIKMLESDKTDSETRFYCLSAIRTIGGPQAVAAITRVLKFGGPNLQESAMNAILDLATGGSASEIDSTEDLVPSETHLPLKPELGTELASVLGELSGRRSLAGNLRNRAVGTMEYLKEMGVLVPELVPVPASDYRERLAKLIEAAFRAAEAFFASLPCLAEAAGAQAGEEHLGGAPHAEEPGEARVFHVPLLKKGGIQEIRLLVLPAILSDPRFKTGKFLSRSENALAVMLSIDERDFPDDVFEIRVAAAISKEGAPDEVIEIPDKERSLFKARRSDRFEFPMSETEFEKWCERPQFRLRQIQ